jgi:hypothetical protein
MPPPKLTRTIKKNIRIQWNEKFPELGVYKNDWILRIVGPMAQGICLDGESGNLRYKPTAHVCVQTKPTRDFISLSMGYRLRTPRDTPQVGINLRQHNMDFEVYVQRFREQIPLPMEGDLRCNDVVKAYMNWDKTHYERDKYPYNSTFDLIGMYIWCGHIRKARSMFRKALKEYEN